MNGRCTVGGKLTTAEWSETECRRQPRRGVSAANQISQMGTTERLGAMLEEAHRRWPERRSEQGVSKANDPSQLGLAEKKQKSRKPACRVFVFALPHSRRECIRAHFFISVFIRVI